MIADFGGRPIGSVATIDTNYVIAGAPPRDIELRKNYDAQLEEARSLELPITTVDEVMQCIGVVALAITHDDGNQHKPSISTN